MSRIWVVLALTFASPVWGKGEKAGVFDYYIAAFSWSPSWCAREGDKRGADQCDARHDFGFILHGLWPQFEQGWPSYCPTGESPPEPAMLGAMVDVMGSTGLARHEWKKHGTCSGLSAEAYFALSRAAFDMMTLPRTSRDIRIRPDRVEQAFIDANPTLAPDGVTVTCRGGYIAEVRICLNRDLSPRICAPDARRDCRAGPQRMPAIR